MKAFTHELKALCLCWCTFPSQTIKVNFPYFCPCKSFFFFTISNLPKLSSFYFLKRPVYSYRLHQFACCLLALTLLFLHRNVSLFSFIYCYYNQHRYSDISNCCITSPLRRNYCLTFTLQHNLNLFFPNFVSRSHYSKRFIYLI